MALSLLFTLFAIPTDLYAGGGHALLLDGTNDYAKATGTVYPNSTTLQSFTVEAWIRPDRAGSVIATDDAFDLILFNQPGAANAGVGIKFAIYGPDFTTSITEFRGVRVGECAHVAAMFDAVTKKYWIAINGILSTSRADFTQAGLSTDPGFAFTVGSFGPSGFFDGFIDEVRVSSVARYQADFAPPQVLTADADTRGLWRFDEPVGTTVFSDASAGSTTLTGFGGAATAISPCSPPDESYTVTPSAGANGSIGPDTPQTVNQGATRQFTVTPNAGYSASVGGTCGGTLAGNAYTTNPIVAACTVAANFALTQPFCRECLPSRGGWRSAIPR